MVIHTTWTFLSDKETIKKIAETLFKLHETESKKNINLKSLESKRLIALKASQNLITAIEQGIITEQTKLRLKELEAQISQLDFDIEQERQRSYTFLSVDMIEKFLNSVICGDIQETAVRKLIVKTFIREIVLDNEKLIITYYFTDQYAKHEITSDETTKIKKLASKKQSTIPINLSSYKLTDCPPNKRTASAVRFFITFKDLNERKRQDRSRHRFKVMWAICGVPENVCIFGATTAWRRVRVSELRSKSRPLRHQKPKSTLKGEDLGFFFLKYKIVIIFFDYT